MPVTVINQSGDGDMDAADAAVRDAQRRRAGAVLAGWRARIAEPTKWAHSRADGFEDFAAAAQTAREMAVPDEVALEDCPVARVAVEAFSAQYRWMSGQRGDLRTLPADQMVLKSAVEVIREHAKLDSRGFGSTSGGGMRGSVLGGYRGRRVAAMPDGGDMGTDYPPLRAAQQERAQLVLAKWLERIAKPLQWTDSWFSGFWDQDAPAAAQTDRAMAVPDEVTLEDCPVAHAALEAFSSMYQRVSDPQDLRTLRADQAVLKSAVEAIREHAKIR